MYLERMEISAILLFSKLQSEILPKYCIDVAFLEAARAITLMMYAEIGAFALRRCSDFGVYNRSCGKVDHHTVA